MEKKLTNIRKGDISGKARYNAEAIYRAEARYKMRPQRIQESFCLHKKE